MDDWPAGVAESAGLVFLAGRILVALAASAGKTGFSEARVCKAALVSEDP